MNVASLKQRLGRIGIWSLELRFGDSGQAIAAASELDALGFGAIWIPGGVGGDVLGSVGRLAAATRKTVIATGILNIWKHQAAEIGDWWQAQTAATQARVLLGLGVSHGPVIGEAYARPLAAMRGFLDQLAEQHVPGEALCLAALGPKMLELAGARTAGVHPYLVSPAHTAKAREILGAGKLVAPEQGVVLESDPERAREMGRQVLEHYRRLPNYVNNWLRLGFSETDVADLSARLVDTIIAWGTVEQIKARVEEHLAAGADHVCLQAITGAGSDISKALPVWRELAAALL